MGWGGSEWEPGAKGLKHTDLTQTRSKLQENFKGKFKKATNTIRATLRMQSFKKLTAGLSAAQNLSLVRDSGGSESGGGGGGVARGSGGVGASASGSGGGGGGGGGGDGLTNMMFDSINEEEEEEEGGGAGEGVREHQGGRVSASSKKYPPTAAKPTEESVAEE